MTNKTECGHPETEFYSDGMNDEQYCHACARAAAPAVEQAAISCICTKDAVWEDCPTHGIKREPAVERFQFCPTCQGHGSFTVNGVTYQCADKKHRPAGEDASRKVRKLDPWASGPYGGEDATPRTTLNERIRKAIEWCMRHSYYELAQTLEECVPAMPLAHEPDCEYSKWETYCTCATPSTPLRELLEKAVSYELNLATDYLSNPDDQIHGYAFNAPRLVEKIIQAALRAATPQPEREGVKMWRESKERERTQGED